ncbi:transglutaminase family protein [Mucilaginibacter arboris]|uniref:Transglutaminase family protein n=1 Tax=Mucilaginibacter arboris TaxID=2682090 RepID=A0A7K1T044_9SPHI|nr:transglutaminase family protein [Mucilaginibacter arboris]MVN22929.1 transglutaminase family protein [Mucilaginibacter arboris]
MPEFHITHITSYLYEEPINDSANQIMLYPIDDENQQVINHRLKITDNPLVETYKDYYDNTVGSFTNPGIHAALVIDSELTVVTHSRKMPEDFTQQKEQWDLLQQIRYQLPYINFLIPQQFKFLPEVLQVAQSELNREQTPLQVAKALSNYIYQNFEYKAGVTTVETTLDEVWELKSGVCQDFAHLLLVMVRMANIPARYVSGYICPNKNGMRGEGATHAWVEAYIPFYGWLGLDPTNNISVNDKHVRLAVGRNFSDCSPVKGTYKGNARHKLDVSVTVGYEGQNPQEETQMPPTPVFTPFNTEPTNSYRLYMEQQQQQQQ